MQLKKMNKKGMALGDLYNAVMILALIGLLIGVVLIVLDEFLLHVKSSAEANASVNETLKAIGDFADWIPLIVIVISAAIILGLVLNTFLKQKVQ